MDSKRLPEDLGATEENIESFSQSGVVRRRPQKTHTKTPIDSAALQMTYRRMLAGSSSSNQAEVARHLGISRVWVRKVLKGIK